MQLTAIPLTAGALALHNGSLCFCSGCIAWRGPKKIKHTYSVVVENGGVLVSPRRLERTNSTMNSYPPSSTGAVVNFDPTVYDSITRTESRRRDSTERRERLQPQPPSTTRPPPSDPLPIPIPIPQHTRKSRDSRHPNDAKYIQPNVPRNSLDVYRSRLERHMSNLNLNVSISISPPEPAPPHLPKQRVRFILDGRIK